LCESRPCQTATVGVRLGIQFPAHSGHIGPANRAVQVHAVPRYLHGIWDLDELYDLQSDPHAQHNLIFSQPYQGQITGMRAELHQRLVAADANRVPFRHERRMDANPRLKSDLAPPVFPPQLLRDQDAQNATRVGVIMGGHALPRRPLPRQNGRVWEQPAGAGSGRVTEMGAGPAARSPWHCVLAARIV